MNNNPLFYLEEYLAATFMFGFPGGSAGKESACNAGDLHLIPGLGRSPGEGKGCPLQYSGLENSTECIVCGVAKSRTWLSFTFTFMLHFFFLITKSLLSEQHFVFREWENNSFLNISCFKSCYLICKQQYRQVRIKFKCWDLSIGIVGIVLIEELSENFFFN